MIETITQSEKFSEALKKIKPDVTFDDRKKAMKDFSISNATVTRYLDGDVRNNDLAAKMLNLFRGRIAQRDKALNHYSQ